MSAPTLKAESRTTAQRMGVLEQQLAEAARGQAEALKAEAHLQAELKRVEAAAAVEAARLRQENATALAALRERAEVAVEPSERQTLEAFSADMVQRLERELAVRDKQAAEQVQNESALFSHNGKKITGKNITP